MADVEISGIPGLAKRSLTALRQEGPDRLILYAIRYLSWKLQFHRLVRSLPNSIATVVYALIRKIVRRTIWLLNRVYPNKYTDADPYECIIVDPSLIEYTSGASRRRGWVIDGEWDKSSNYFMQRTHPKAIEQRFVDGLQWSETALFDKYDYSKLNNRGKEIDRLYQHIRNDGYKSQRQLVEQTPSVAWKGLNDAMHPLANEVAVDVGSDGQLLWNMCGQHRLAIAKILDLDRIPVQVFRRHVEWQAIRDRIRRKEKIPEEFHDHPDLVELLRNE